MKKFQIGDLVTTSVATEALYSGIYGIYPEQWYTPGMVGKVVFTDSPAMMRDVDQYVIKFQGTEYGNQHHPNNTWTVRLDTKHVRAIKCD